MAVSEHRWALAAKDNHTSVPELQDMIREINAGRKLLPEEMGQVWYRDRDGDPITLGEWSILFGSLSYRFVADTELNNGIWVATIWQGVTGCDEPLFETTAFGSHPRMGKRWKECGVYAVQTYDTETQALAGHDQLVARFRDYPG